LKIIEITVFFFRRVCSITFEIPLEKSLWEWSPMKCIYYRVLHNRVTNQKRFAVVISRFTDYLLITWLHDTRQIYLMGLYPNNFPLETTNLKKKLYSLQIKTFFFFFSKYFEYFQFLNFHTYSFIFVIFYQLKKNCSNSVHYMWRYMRLKTLR